MKTPLPQIVGRMLFALLALTGGVACVQGQRDEIFIPAGSFQMGCDGSNPTENDCNVYDWQAQELPLHTVTLAAYYIDKYEVTNGRYQACVAAKGCTEPQASSSYTRTLYYGDPAYVDYPVVNVTWAQASAFCTWAGKRLPTEAEWEKAARGSTDTRMYPWGNEPATCTLANSWAPVGDCMGDTGPVGSYPDGASPYGVMDMVGNAWEWVNDWYDETYYSVSPPANPQGPTAGDSRVVRGGAWYDRAGSDVRITSRSGGSPTLSNYFAGFRCARSS